jgi:hypothetical protein
MQENFFASEAAQAAGAGALGLLGRVMTLARADRRPLGWSLLWEIPVAIGMGIIGSGMADFLNLQNFAHHAMTISTGYLGPRILDQLFDRWFPPLHNRRKDDKSVDNNK